MKDFIRIGGEITSAPLNENFRRLRNDITISNTNLIFSKEYGIQMTVKDMKDLITNPEVNLENGQACYVVSSGELYRFATYDMQWHKIADFGQTFRQGFLNSGVVTIQYVSPDQKAYITKKNNTTLTIPAMLVYFKTLMGNENYLKGMYNIPEQDLDVSAVVETPGAYSIFLDGTKVDIDHDGEILYFINSGMPKQDNPNAIYMGGFMIDDSGHVVNDFIYTIPDIAYTADRGFFYLSGGQITGGYLQPTTVSGNSVMGVSGLYYDEGINAPQGNLEDFPIESYGGSNYNIRAIGAEGATEGLSKLIYMYPDNPLSNEWTDTHGALIYDKVYDESTQTLKTIEPGQFTIQRHLITPCGFDCTDVILYGKRVYNSLSDAISNINKPDTLDLEFPYVEVTRVIVGNPLSGAFTTDNPGLCSFNTLERISQIGTFEPEFADDKFILYSGNLADPNPARTRFNLDELEDEDYNELYTLYVLPYNTERYDFALTKKYITDGIQTSAQLSHEDIRTVEREGSGINGYELADAKDLDALRHRVEDIEKEIWDVINTSTQHIYEQSVRYRLFHLEDRVSGLETRTTQAESDIDTLYKTKVHKNTTINGYKLGDDLTTTGEVKTIRLYTGDITEGAGAGATTNLWYTDARVIANPNVTAAYSHTLKHGDGTVNNANPHGMSLDNINDGTTYHSVTTTEKNKIGNLPNNTVSELQQLQNTKIDSILIKQVDGNGTTTTGVETNLGSVKSLRFFEQGANITIAGDMATIECVGQMDRNTVMFKSDYATLSMLDPGTYTGTVDKAAEAFIADNINGIASAGINKYYGTDDQGAPGTYNLPVYVSSADGSSYATIDDVTFQPINKSIRLAHLGDSTVTYGPTDEETTLGTNLHDLVVNHYHKALDSATLKSSEINEWNFGNNLTVTVSGHRATINATGSGSAGVSRFANLDDVNVTYTGNAGKLVVVNEDENGLVLSSAPSFSNYMLKSTYVSTVDPRKVNLAVSADRALSADSATTALTLQNAYSVNDGGLSDTALWSAQRIMEYTNTTTPDTYSGNAVPSPTLGKDGDLYILIEA